MECARQIRWQTPSLGDSTSWGGKGEKRDAGFRVHGTLAPSAVDGYAERVRLLKLGNVRDSSLGTFWAGRHRFAALLTRVGLELGPSFVPDLPKLLPRTPELVNCRKKIS